MFDLDQVTPALPTNGLHVVDPAVAPPTKAEKRYQRRVTKRRYARLEARAAAVDRLRPLPGVGESIHGVMDGRFGAWSLAEAMIDLLGEPVEELTISTLGFNRPNCESLLAMLDQGEVRHVLLNVSNYFRHSDRTIFADIRRELEQRGQCVAITRSHAKLLLFRTTHRNIVIETSANLRSSQNYEQFTVGDDAELLTFHRTWLEELCRAAQ